MLAPNSSQFDPEARSIRQRSELVTHPSLSVMLSRHLRLRQRMQFGQLNQRKVITLLGAADELIE